MKPVVDAGEPRRARRDAGLYGRRKGKTLRPYQAGLMETLLPQLQVELSGGSSIPAASFRIIPTICGSKSALAAANTSPPTPSRIRNAAISAASPS